MDPEEYNRLFGAQSPDSGGTPAPTPEVGPAQEPQAQPTEQPTGPATTGVIGALNRVTSPLDPVADALKSAGTGAMKAVFETKDFLFGDTPREQQSWVRQYTEERNDQLREEAPLINGFSSGVGQFATAMVGLGKFSKAAEVVPWVGRGFNVLRGSKTGVTAMESGKAALAGAVAFDPYEERLSNLIQGTPLANPFTAWLAADPNDSAAMGRLKTAMESIGMDAAIIGTFAGSLRIWKYLKHGDTRNAKRAVGELEAKIAQETTPAEDVPTTATTATKPDLEAADLGGVRHDNQDEIPRQTG